MNPISIYWHDEEQAILVWEFHSKYTLEELLPLVAKSNTMISSHPSKRVDVIMQLNHQEVANTPNLFVNFAGAFAHTPAQVGTIVFVAPSMYAQSFIQSIQKVGQNAKRVARFASSRNEAVDRILDEREQMAVREG